MGSGETLSGEVRGHSSSLLPSVLQELLSQSCLIPAMSSYLRNDSGRTCCHTLDVLCALLFAKVKLNTAFKVVEEDFVHD